MNKIIFSLVLICGSLLFTSCEDDLVVGSVNQSSYNNIGKLEASLKDKNSGLSDNIIELRTKECITSVCVNLTKAPMKGVDFAISYDAEYLNEYNTQHGTNFKLFPQNLISLDGASEANILMAPDEKQSLAVNLTIQPASTDLEEGTTYVLPLKITTTTEGISLSSTSHCIYLIKNYHNEADCDKGADAVKNFLYFEVNDTNPLNALEFIREDGKLFFDYVVLFAANINWNAETGRVYVYNNPNVQFMLDNNEQYLQPLRKRGIKVLLGVLGNHDEAGVCQLSDMGCKEFARELAAICNAYYLDGVNFDDEYSNYPNLDNPWLTYKSSEAGAKLLYETKKAMPDKYVTVYYLGSLESNCPSVYGITPNNFVDIVVADYAQSTRPMTGMTQKQCAGMSVELRRGYGDTSEDYARSVKEDGYGFYMWFALDPSLYPIQVYRIQNVSRGLYNQEVKYPTFYYKKNDTTQYSR